MNRKIVLRFYSVFISIILVWLLLDLINVYDQIQLLKRIPDELWLLLFFMIWFCAVIDLFKQYSFVSKWLLLLIVALLLWMSSTTILAIILLSLHVKMEGHFNSRFEIELKKAHLLGCA